MLLPKEGNPNYYRMLFRNVNNFFYGMKRPDLVEDLTSIIHEKIEKPMGSDIQLVLIAYKNLPSLDSFTRSLNPIYAGANIRKYTIQKWLDEIEVWCFRQIFDLEGQIRFTTPARQFV